MFLYVTVLSSLLCLKLCVECLCLSRQWAGWSASLIMLSALSLSIACPFQRSALQSLRLCGEPSSLLVLCFQSRQWNLQWGCSLLVPCRLEWVGDGSDQPSRAAAWCSIAAAGTFSTVAVRFKVQLRFDVEGQELVAIGLLLKVNHYLVIIFIEDEVVLLCIANNAIYHSHCIKVILLIKVCSS